jgi:hypothetical protein
MKNIYAKSYILTKIVLLIEAVLFIFAVFIDLEKFAILVIGFCALITAVYHGSVCERYEAHKRLIKEMAFVKYFGEFMEQLSKEIDKENENEK